MNPTPPITQNIVSLGEIEETSTLIGRRFAVDGGLNKPADAALSGSFNMVRLRSGIVVHTTDITELHDMTTRVEQQPGLTVHVFLEGTTDARLGGVPLELGRQTGQAVKGVITARAEPDLFERHAHEGDHVRKVNVTLTSAWLADSAFATAEEYEIVSRFASSHHSRFSWTPPASVISIAEQMLHPPATSGLMRNLYLESRALDLVAEAFGALTRQSEVDRFTRLKPFDRRRLRLIEDYLAEHGHEVTSLDELARIGGVSASTLRRLFQGAYGTTVFDHLRSLGLERARLALEREGISVSEAAFLAGYTNPANFATAFKRRFGLTPTDVRRL